METLHPPETFVPLHPALMSQNDIPMETAAAYVQRPVPGAESSSEDRSQEYPIAHAPMPQQVETPHSSHQYPSQPDFERALAPTEEPTKAAAAVDANEPEVSGKPPPGDVVSLGASTDQSPGSSERPEPEVPATVPQPSSEDVPDQTSNGEGFSAPEIEHTSSRDEASSGASPEPPVTSRDLLQEPKDDCTETHPEELSQAEQATDILADICSTSAAPCTPSGPHTHPGCSSEPMARPESNSDRKSLIVVLKKRPGQAPTDFEGASSASTPAGDMAVTPPSEAYQTAQTPAVAQSGLPTPRRTNANKENFAPGLYARERNTRRAATKAFREVATPPKKAQAPVQEVGKPLASPQPEPVERPAKRKAAEQKEPAPKRRKSETAKPKRSTRRTAQNDASMEQLLSLAKNQSSGNAEQRPKRDRSVDEFFVEQICEGLRVQEQDKRRDMGWRQASRILDLLGLAKYPSEEEALFLTTEEASSEVGQGRFTKQIIFTTGQQRVPLQTVDQFLGEYYDDDALVWIQDPEVKPSKKAQICRQVKISQVKERFAGESKNKPWNLLELATHCDDGLRPAFLNTEDCRLLTKLKIPETQPEARRRTYLPGYKEVEKWALVAQAGALTEPHQDSHGYSTFITVNMGLVGFGWLCNPSKAERDAWCRNPSSFRGGQWRYVILKPGQTVYFPAGTVHFVFRLPATGNTLAFGGHILRCSNIVHWMRTLIEERNQKDVTNEDLTESAPGYLARVEKFVNQAKVNGTMDKWGGEESIEEFLRLKQEFLSRKQK